ncbi:MAG: hypothetical protein V4534_06635 [Myxococcota bacterium]
MTPAGSVSVFFISMLVSSPSLTGRREERLALLERLYRNLALERHANRPTSLLDAAIQELENEANQAATPKENETDAHSGQHKGTEDEWDLCADPDLMGGEPLQRLLAF